MQCIPGFGQYSKPNNANKAVYWQIWLNSQHPISQSHSLLFLLAGEKEERKKKALTYNGAENINVLRIDGETSELTPNWLFLLGIKIFC